MSLTRYEQVWGEQVKGPPVARTDTVRKCQALTSLTHSAATDRPPLLQVMLSTNEENQKFVKVRVRTICIPQVSLGIRYEIVWI